MHFRGAAPAAAAAADDIIINDIGKHDPPNHVSERRGLCCYALRNTMLIWRTSNILTASW